MELVVEVLSPKSQVRNRERKPRLYARAGVRFFWRIEKDGQDAVLYEYEKDSASPSRDYGRSAIHRGTFKTSIPVELEFDLANVLRH